MRIILFQVGLLSVTLSFAQPDTTIQSMRAFPITGYMVELNDRTKLVQVEMPDGFFLKEKQLGVVWGVYKGSKTDAIQKGYGRCYLIKGNYYYFAISKNTSGIALQQGDLLYTLMDRTPGVHGMIPSLAAHFIRLQNVYESPFYDRYTVFLGWSEKKDRAVLDSIVADIQFTGQYFLRENASMDKTIADGDYKGSRVLYVMAECQPTDVIKFLEYVIARPRLYAGRDWKVSEVFATWLSEGAPTVLKKE